ncbi:MAG: ABC transporter ATP-binding protein [Candidatus Micrarchaeia archaeon]
MTSDIAVKVENLTKIYKLYDKPIDRLKEALNPFGKKYHKDFYALKDVSFEVKKGETVGIIGKNGAGKSTLLKIITGVLTPTSGSIQVNGRIASLLELGAGFNPEYTGIENIYLQGTLMGYTREEIDAKLDEIISFADIGEFIHQPVKMYSSGMFARLAFAVAINVDPDILIVDEALSVGDIFFVEKCISKVNYLLSRGNTTLIFVSHDLTILRRVVRRCIWMENGSIFKDGNALELIDYYASNVEKKTHTFQKNLNLIQRDFLWKEYKVRFGTQKCEITKVYLNGELLSFNGIYTLKTGEDVVIKIYFKSNVDEIIPITLSVAFFSIDRVHCFGISPKFQKVFFHSNDTCAVCKIYNLPLLRGKYSLSVGIWDERIIVPFDLQERCYDIVIVSDSNSEDGMFLPNYLWSK